MRIPVILFVVVLNICAIPQLSLSQTGGEEEFPKMDCPLLQAVRHVDSSSLKLYGTEELKLIISSPGDTTVKASLDGVVSAVQRESDGTYEIIFNHDDLWFWISGISQPVVRPKQRITKGQAIGYLKKDAKLEILLFDFETPVDPAEYLPCFAKP